MKDVDEDDALYLFLYVNGMLIASKSADAVIELKSTLLAKFEIKDLGLARKILHLKICKDRSKGILHLS